jgi:hypothetical protein
MREYSARIYRPSFCDYKPKGLVFCLCKQAFLSCFRENWVYEWYTECPFVCIGSPHPLPTSEYVSFPPLGSPGENTIACGGEGGGSQFRRPARGFCHSVYSVVDACPIATEIVHISEYTRKLHSLVFSFFLLNRPV